MPNKIGSVENDRDLKTKSKAAYGLNEATLPPIHISEREDAETIRKAQWVAPQALRTTALPTFVDRPLTDRVSVGKVEDKKATRAVLDFPNLAWEAIDAGLRKEQLTNIELSGHIAHAKEHQANIDLLLDLSAELSSHPENVSELTEKAKEKLEALKYRGIDLWKGEDKKITKDRLSELKTLVSTRVEKERSDLSILNIGAIMETLKDISRNNSRLASTISGNTRR
jgi:hypothetical protein